MKKSAPVLALLALTLCSLESTASAQTASPTTPAAGTVVVQGAGIKPRRVAPAWVQGRTYKFHDLVSYDGFAFQAGSGSAHKRPNPLADDGWEKLNACDDMAEGAVLCEAGNAATTTDSKEEAQREYSRVKQDMQKGKPTMSPES
ncbi:MAG TPA: hypothetical protein VIF60_07115 [Burkholderiaceae bacterium]|jgi:hypothetical protein